MLRLSITGGRQLVDTDSGEGRRRMVVNGGEEDRLTVSEFLTSFLAI